jgi:hypothetical protein
MAESDLQAVAFPKLSEAQVAASAMESGARVQARATW